MAHSNKLTIFGFDPGEATGVCELRPGGSACLYTFKGLDKLVDFLDEISDFTLKETVYGVETYDPQRFSGQLSMEPSWVEGAIRSQASLLGLDLKSYTPAAIKGSVRDEFVVRELEKLGSKAKTQHELDAARVAFKVRAGLNRE